MYIIQWPCSSSRLWFKNIRTIAIYSDSSYKHELLVQFWFLQKKLIEPDRTGSDRAIPRYNRYNMVQGREADAPSQFLSPPPTPGEASITDSWTVVGLEKLLFSISSLKAGSFWFFAVLYMDLDGDMGGDKLILRGLKFHGFHGVKPEERTLGQKFLVDVDAWMDLKPAGKSDSLTDTVSYTDIYRITKEVMEGIPHNLLESVAELIASTTLIKHPQISAVRVKVGKPHVAVLGSVDYLGVEIVRFRST